jgi:uncharacterized protein YxjI
MRYRLQQKLLAWGDDFTIQDDEGRDVYLVDGKAFSLGKQLSFQDAMGRELAFMRQRLMRFNPTFEIFIDGDLHAVITKQRFSLFKCRFLIDLPGPDDIDAEGDFLDHEYRFTRDGRTVATVSRQWLTLRDTYGVDVAEENDVVPVLCGVVVIDLMCHGNRK